MTTLTDAFGLDIVVTRFPSVLMGRRITTSIGRNDNGAVRFAYAMDIDKLRFSFKEIAGESGA